RPAAVGNGRKGASRPARRQQIDIQPEAPIHVQENRLMLKRIAAIALGSLVFVAFAQGPTVSPVHGNGTDQEDSGTSSASVDQRVNLHLPPTVALHLDVSELVFDMRHIGNTDDYVCVYGALEDDEGPMGFHGQPQHLPLGTSYAVNQDWTAESDPTIEILDATDVAT